MYSKSVFPAMMYQYCLNILKPKLQGSRPDLIIYDDYVDNTDKEIQMAARGKKKVAPVKVTKKKAKELVKKYRQAYPEVATAFAVHMNAPYKHPWPKNRTQLTELIESQKDSAYMRGNRDGVEEAKAKYEKDSKMLAEKSKIAYALAQSMEALSKVILSINGHL